MPSFEDRGGGGNDVGGAFGRMSVGISQLVTDTELENIGKEVRLDTLRRIVNTFEPGGVDTGLVAYLQRDGTSKELFHYVRAGQDKVAAYHIQSTTKAIIGTLTMYAMMTTGDSLDDTAFSLAPGLREIFRRNAKDLEPLTVRQLLNHCSGLGMHTDPSLWRLEPIEQLQGIRRDSSETSFIRYSNLGFDVLGIFLREYISNHPKILESLGHQTGSTDKTHPAAQLHKLLIGGDSFAFKQYLVHGQGCIVGSGLANSNIHDLVRLPICLARRPHLAERLLVPINKVAGFSALGVNPTSSMPRYENPERVANGFFVMPYGYATRGSFENNIDVAIRAADLKDLSLSATGRGTGPQIVVITLSSNEHPNQAASALGRETLLGELFM